MTTYRLGAMLAVACPLDNMPTPLRDRPYIWVTWISGLIAGEKQCKWAAWHKSHFNFNKTPSDFDSVSYMIKHTALKDSLLNDLRGRDCEILLEQKLHWKGERATLAGRIDALAFNKDRGMVFEFKSGKESAADKAQLMIYMWAVRRAWKRFKNTLLDGMLVYSDKRVRVAATEIDEKFCKIVEGFLKDLIENEPERRYPSFRDCKYCNIADCEERFGDVEIDEESSDLVPEFL